MNILIMNEERNLFIYFFKQNFNIFTKQDCTSIFSKIYIVLIESGVGGLSILCADFIG